MKYAIPILLLTAANVFMMFAWYGHLKFKDSPLWLVVIVSWAIAFFEYWLQVPANRIGHQYWDTAHLKVLQEAITLAVFILFSTLYMREDFKWNYALGFVFIGLAVFVVFKKW